MNRLFVLMAFVALSSGVIGPPEIAAQTLLGVRAGVNLANFSGNHLAEFEDRKALNVGAFLDLPLSGRFGLRFGIGYLGKGAEAAFSGGTGESAYAGRIDYRYGYVDVPLMLRFSVIQGRSASAHLLLGPALSFNTSCELDMSGPDLNGTVDCDGSGLDVRTLDLGARAGIGIDARVFDGLWVVGESHYSRGLRTVDTSGEGVKNRGFSLTLGLAIPIG